MTPMRMSIFAIVNLLTGIRILIIHLKIKGKKNFLLFFCKTFEIFGYLAGICQMQIIIMAYHSLATETVLSCEYLARFPLWIIILKYFKSEFIFKIKVVYSNDNDIVLLM